MPRASSAASATAIIWLLSSRGLRKPEQAGGYADHGRISVQRAVLGSNLRKIGEIGRARLRARLAKRQ